MDSYHSSVVDAAASSGGANYIESVSADGSLHVSIHLAADSNAGQYRVYAWYANANADSAYGIANVTSAAFANATPDPYGYYTYYEEFEDYQYYIVSVTAKNTGSTEFAPSGCTVKADMPYDTIAEGKLILLNRVGSNFTETLAADMECNRCQFILAKKKRVF